MSFKEAPDRDFPGSAVDKNPPCNSGDMGSIPGQGTRIIHAQSNWAYPPELLEAASLNYWAHVQQWESTHCDERSHMKQQRSHMLQLRPGTAKEITILENRQHFISLLPRWEPWEVRMQWELRGVFWEFTLEIRMWDWHHKRESTDKL